MAVFPAKAIQLLTRISRNRASATPRLPSECDITQFVASELRSNANVGVMPCIFAAMHKCKA